MSWSAIVCEGPILLRRAFIAPLVAFVLFYGWYFLLSWDPGTAWIVPGNLAYGVAGVQLGAAVLISKATTDANGAAT